MRQVFRMLTAVIVVLATWLGTIIFWYIATSHDPEYQSKGIPLFVTIGGFPLGLAVASFLTRERPRKRTASEAERVETSPPPSGES